MDNTPIEIMGILNVTPDSFSDGGKYLSVLNAVTHAERLIKDGADIIDVGGESTRPGSKSVSIDEECSRVIPVIESIAKKYPDVKISIDTTKSIVSTEAINAGASIINDISGGTFDEKNMENAAIFDIPFVIMHIKGTPENMQKNPSYNNVVDEISEYFQTRILAAKKYGVNKIILDPGIGFGKRIQDNYDIISNLDRFSNFKYPILVGVSKKSFLGNSLGLEIDERENSTIIAETISAMNGASIIRTHNVKNAVELKKISSLINFEVN